MLDFRIFFIILFFMRLLIVKFWIDDFDSGIGEFATLKLQILRFGFTFLFLCEAE